jgi:hypothetical protein
VTCLFFFFSCTGGETGPWNKVMKHQEVLGGDYNQCFEGGKVNIVHIQQITGNPKNAILEFVRARACEQARAHAAAVTRSCGHVGCPNALCVRV